jgi:polysaccharide biosynthesis transport protein
LMAGLAGLLLSAGSILLVDHLDSSVRTVDEAEKHFGLPVLAAVPEAKAEDIQGTAVMTEDTGGPQAEAFRNLRASLSLLGEEAKRRFFVVTSAIPSEGKTFSSTNLAASLAIQGFRTILVDADLRRPALSANLITKSDRKNEEYRGLSDVLAGVCTPAEAIKETEVQNLWLLPAGRRAPNPGELLSQNAMLKLLEKFLSEYDRVILDTAPVCAVSDALSLAPHAHACVVVVRYGKTPRRAIKRAVTLLQKSGAKLAGLVLNRMPTSRGASYYYYYYGDAYESGGGSKGSKKRRSK